MKKWNYYNDTDPKVCAWAKELIKAKLVPDGEVDCRSIEDIRPDEIKDFIQCHFFCGILGWPLALRLSGWPDDKPVWTGSCPCQPFSTAGKGAGIADERHLWPAFKWLIDQCRPPVVFGEQVASKDGREWLSGVRADLEDLGFTVGAADLCAASVGAPHIRQRLFWLGVANSAGWQPGQPTAASAGHGASLDQQAVMAGWNTPHCPRERLGQLGIDVPGPTNPWWDFYLVPCQDGKTRRIGTGIQPLAHGLPGRVGLLRGYGNAIVPQVAAEFIQACEEAINTIL